MLEGQVSVLGSHLKQEPGLSSHRPDTMVPNLRSALRAEKNSQLIAEQCALRPEIGGQVAKILFVSFRYYIILHSLSCCFEGMQNHPV